MGGDTVEGAGEAQCLPWPWALWKPLETRGELIKRGGRQSKCQGSPGYLQVPLSLHNDRWHLQL